MTDPDWFGKVKRWDVKRAKLLQGKGWIRIEMDLGTALRCSSCQTLGQETAQMEVVQLQRVRMKWEWRRRGEDDW
jgi:hypothetical protein